MKLSEIKGLKYPDEYIIKFFFSNQMQVQKDLNVLELGCGNGSNLMLPYNYDNNVIGVDFDSTLIEYAKHNFQLIANTSKYNFYDTDIREYVKNNCNLKIDILLLPSVIYYIDKNSFINLLDNLISNQLLRESIPFYIRFRTIRDFRFGLGKKIEKNCYKMPADSIT
ncbi:methyltransferase domain-containing protein, partial [Poseidonibacter sp.]|uniref:methyltransferase domain-containing protein n=1 Tax=Poseidonibacter sp. TaxID=2321188 RepID=UPI003C77A297